MQQELVSTNNNLVSLEKVVELKMWCKRDQLDRKFFVNVVLYKQRTENPYYSIHISTDNGNVYYRKGITFNLEDKLLPKDKLIRAFCYCLLDKEEGFHIYASRINEIRHEDENGFVVENILSNIEKYITDEENRCIHVSY